MPRLPAHTVESAPAAARPILQLVRNRRGEITEVVAGLANSPAALAMLVGMEASLDSYATLDRKTRAAVSLTVSGANGCSYGEAAHKAAALTAGWSPDDVLMISRGTPGVDPALDALLVVAREIVAEHGVVAPASWARARATGWTDGELAELFAHVVIAMFTDCFAQYAGTEAGRPPAASPSAESPPPDPVVSVPAREPKGWMRRRRTSAPGWTGR